MPTYTGSLIDKKLALNVSYVFQDLGKSLSDDEVALGSKYYVREVLGTYAPFFFLVTFADICISGAFATVKLVVRKDTGESFAAKIVDKKKFQLNNSTKRPNALMDEVDILSKLRHSNVHSSCSIQWC